MAESPQILKDPVKYIERYFKIIAKPVPGSAESPLVPMKLYRAQKHYITNRSPRDIILKPRQIRISTAVMAANAHLLFTSPYQRQVIIANDDETATFLLTTVERFWRNLPPNMRPATDWKSGAHMRFPDLDSYIYIDSAKSDTIGIGHGLNTAHLCLHPDSLVLLSDGYMKPIKDIIAGDCSYSQKNGNLVKVKKVFTRQFKGNLCKLTFYGNPQTPLICTPEHRVIGRSDKGGWQRADECKWLGSPIRKITGKMSEIPLWHYTSGNEKTYEQRGSVNLDREFGWIVGLYYAEGCHKGGHKGVTFGLSTDEIEFAARITSFCQKYGWGTGTRTINTHGIIKGREVNGKALCVDVNDHEFGSLMSGIAGQGRDKAIPDWFWDCPKEFLDGVIDGYVDGDGSYAEKDERYYVTSKRPQLLYQLRELLLSVRNQYGGVSYSKARECWCLIYPMVPCKDNKHYKDGAYQFVKFGHIYRQPYVFVKLRSREYIPYDGEVYDLETKGSFKTPSGMVHNSEFARWPSKKANQLFADISGTIPPGAGYITIESTSQGRNKFYDMYNAAKNGEIDYKPFFYPWWWVEDYILPVKRPMEYSKEEKALIAHYNLTPEQIAFRRFKIAEIKDLFFQEYPEDEVSCWLSSDISIIDATVIRNYTPLIRPGREEGNLTIWKDVIGGHVYKIGADVAAGTAKGDYSVAAVLDVRANEYVARLRGRIAPDLFAEQLMRLGYRYNEAEIGVEKASHGHTVIHILLQNNYPTIYYHNDYDVIMKNNVSQPGWKTSIKTKPMMVDDIVTALRSNDLMLYSENFLAEISALSWNGQKIEKQSGRYDDEFDALAIALQLRSVAPIVEPKRAIVSSYARI